MLIENKQKKEYGFTLIEVIVAIFILTVGVGGSFMLIQQTLAGVSIVESRLIAIYLGQEAIEIIRNIRENNWLEQRDSWQVPPVPLWNDGLTACQPPVSCCEADYSTDTSSPPEPLVTVIGCDFDELSYLNFDNSGFYSYSAGAQTKFKRKILIDIDETNENKIKVTAVVQWKEKSRLHEIKIIEHITNWYKQRIQ